MATIHHRQWLGRNYLSGAVTYLPTTLILFTILQLISHQMLRVGIFSAITAIVWQFFAILRVSQSIATDSFISLSRSGQFGLVIVTVSLLLMLFTINIYASRKLRYAITNPVIALAINLLCAFFLFVLFWGVSPQLFYLYYQLVFDGLPWQWVIRDWLPIKQTLLLLFPGHIHNTSSLAAGIALVMQLAQVVFTYKLLTPKRER